MKQYSAHLNFRGKLLTFYHWFKLITQFPLWLCLVAEKKGAADMMSYGQVPTWAHLHTSQTTQSKACCSFSAETSCVTDSMRIAALLLICVQWSRSNPLYHSSCVLSHKDFLLKNRTTICGVLMQLGAHRQLGNAISVQGLRRVTAGIDLHPLECHTHQTLQDNLSRLFIIFTSTTYRPCKHNIL